MSATVE